MATESLSLPDAAALLQLDKYKSNQRAGRLLPVPLGRFLPLEEPLAIPHPLFTLERYECFFFIHTGILCVLQGTVTPMRRRTPCNGSSDLFEGIQI